MKQQSTTIEAWVIVVFVAAGIMSFAGVVVETAVNISFPTLMREFGVSTSSGPVDDDDLSADHFTDGAALGLPQTAL